MASIPRRQPWPQGSAPNGPVAKVAPLPPQFEFDPKNKLAEGSGGAVYVCNDPRYAVKQILLSKLENAEVAVMAFVQRGSMHTRCVGLVDYYCDSKHAFLVMEKAADCLIDYVAKRHGSGRWFTCQEVHSAAVAMLESIEALHDNNILHRDIKPVLCHLAWATRLSKAVVLRWY